MNDRQREETLMICKNERLANRCREVLKEFKIKPDIFLTQRDSIQLEFERKNGRYLEYELFSDRTEVFYIDEFGGEKEDKFQFEEVQKLHKWLETFHR